MTTTSVRRKQIVASLRNKAYRDALAEEGINEGVPFQIRAMRQARGWSQKELAKRLGMTQHGISRLENPNYGKFTLTTLKRLAPIFDVALVVKYVPFSHLADAMANLSPTDLAVPDYEHDTALVPVYSPQDTTQKMNAYPGLRMDIAGIGRQFGAQTPIPHVYQVPTGGPSRGWNSYSDTTMSRPLEKMRA